MTDPAYNATRDPGLTYEITARANSYGRMGRLALWNGNLLCLDHSSRSRGGKLYGILATPNGRTATGTVRLQPSHMDKPSIYLGDEITFTVTKPPRDESHAGVYLHEDGYYAVYSPLGDMYHLNGERSPGSDFSLNNYTPVEQGTTFTIIVTA